VWENDSSAELSITSVGLPGYYNNGVVDAADYVVWRKTDGTPAGYNTWRTHLGQFAGNGSTISSNVAAPEPATWALLVCTVVGIRTRRQPNA
jgi:hypothetical protein